MKNNKKTNTKKRNINIPTSVLVILVIVALVLGALLIFRDAGLINSAFQSVKELYGKLFG